jgi:hypothetical protein
MRICTPFANALRSHWRGTEVDIIPIVTSRTGAPHALIPNNITVIPNWDDQRNDYPDKPPRHSTRDTTRIIFLLHIYTHCAMAPPLAPHLPHEVLRHLQQLHLTFRSCPPNKPYNRYTPYYHALPGGERAHHNFGVSERMKKETPGLNLVYKASLMAYISSRSLYSSHR